MIKFRKDGIKIKFLDTSIIVVSKKRNVFNLLDSTDVEILKELETNLKECKTSFRLKMSYNTKKDILKVALNEATYILNAILV